MKKTTIALIAVGVIAVGLLFWLFAPPSVGNPQLATDADSIARGAYAYNAAGCGSCHEPEGTDAPIGGYTIEQEMTVAGITMNLTFHAPNITPDPETGIGGWTGKDFLRALKHGRSPGGGFYWPAFPYRSYRFLTDQDVLDIGAYLMSLQPVRHEDAEQEVPWYLPRLSLAGWQKLAPMMEGTPEPVSGDPQIQRGAYLARAMGHCGECHTPRNSLGMMLYDQEFSGFQGVAPAITGDELSDYDHDAFVGFLSDGMTANFDFVGGEMADVIGHTSKLIPEDRDAYAAFFLRD